MWRLTERMVRSGLVMAWRLATSPTSTSPVLEKPTTDGVVRPPSALGMTTGSPASRTLHHRVGGAEVDSYGLGHVVVLLCALSGVVPVAVSIGCPASISNLSASVSTFLCEETA